MKTTIVGSENVLVRKAPVSERPWVRKGLGPNRRFLLGPKGLGSDTSDIPNGSPTDEWTDGLTDGWLAGTFKQIIARCRIKSNVKVQSSYLTKTCICMMSNLNDTVIIVRE